MKFEFKQQKRSKKGFFKHKKTNRFSEKSISINLLKGVYSLSQSQNYLFTSAFTHKNGYYLFRML